MGDEIESPLQVGGINHAEDASRLRRVLPEIHQDIPCDPLVGSLCAKAVAARKVEQFDLLTMLADELARLLLHGDPRIVADLLTQSRQGVEERGLAAVGIADDGVGLGKHDRQAFSVAKGLRVTNAMGDR